MLQLRDYVTMPYLQKILVFIYLSSKPLTHYAGHCLSLQ